MGKTTAVAAVGTTAVAKQATGSRYVTELLEAFRADFLAANEGLDMDYVRMGVFLKISKKGNFVEAQDEDASYGDTLDVVIGQGEQRYMLWGAKDSPEDGKLIVAELTKEGAEEKLSAWLMEDQERAERYTLGDIQLRYYAFAVPVSSLQPDEYPQVFLVPFSRTDTIGFGGYARDIFQGKYRKMGVPGRIGVNAVVTRLETEEREGRNKTESYLGVKFTPVGMFNPADYGIDVLNVDAEVPPAEADAPLADAAGTPGTEPAAE